MFIPVQLDKPITSAEKTFTSLRKAIVEGELASGSKLSESELSTKFGVSRAVVREAIHRLSGSGLVDRQPNVGARVAELSSEGLENLFQVREALEGMAARLAACNMTDAAITRLNTLLEASQQEISEHGSYYQAEGSPDFHHHILLGCGNQHLISVLLDDLYHLTRMYRVRYGMDGPSVLDAYEDHRAIIRAISNRDGELAEMLMRRHIQSSLVKFKAGMKQELQQLTQ